MQAAEKIRCCHKQGKIIPKRNVCKTVYHQGKPELKKHGLSPQQVKTLQDQFGNNNEGLDPSFAGAEQQDQDTSQGKQADSILNNE